MFTNEPYCKVLPIKPLTVCSDKMMYIRQNKFMFTKDLGLKRNSQIPQMFIANMVDIHFWS